MNKYVLSVKVQVVQHYLSGVGGHKVTATRFGIDHRAVRKWSAAWKCRGGRLSQAVPERKRKTLVRGVKDKARCINDNV
ncbi:hypothetical protein HA38_14050 [Pantoea allii]|nr:hypothetical protein HA38_14050 [Pantoea allii]PBJ98742.1 hypothetical protein CMR03_18775 [Pantoea allii]